MGNISEKQIEEVEKALGIKLYICQKDYILNGNIACPNDRCTGYTTAYCIKLLLTEGEPIKLWDWEQMARLADYKLNNTYVDFFRNFIVENYERLRRAGITTRIVEFKRVKDGEYSQYSSRYHGSRFL